MHNFKRYFEDQPRTALDEKEYKKKLGQVGRTLDFGIHLMNGEVVFNTVRPESRFDIQAMMDKLTEEYNVCPLPDKPNATDYDDFLFHIRMEILKEEYAK
jgi:hypothetical protein